MPASSNMTPEIKRAIRSWILSTSLGLVGYGAIIFLSAGQLDWVWGWVFLALMAIFLASHVVILVPTNPALLAERNRGLRTEGTKRWDILLTPIAGGVMPLISWVIAGLDQRFDWTGETAVHWHLAGLLATMLGMALFLWALGANAFFSEGVRIQKERGHVVVSVGPYRFVRHPGYAGAILWFLGTPLLLGSPWALIPTFLGVGGYVLRTALEDRVLHDELEGYPVYAQKTPYRLIPGIW